jgi:hypothetical protein
MPHRAPLLREILQTFLADYLRVVEPDSAEHLDLGRITFPVPDLPDWPQSERRDTGLVAEIPARWGEKVTLVLQIEPEALTPAELSRRLGGYFMDLEIHYCQPVLLNVLYLRGGRPGINLETAPVCRIFDMDVLRIYFTAFGLGTSRAEYFLERPEPVSWALSAVMQPVHHSRARHRTLCLERIAAADLPEDQRVLLTKFVEVCLGEPAR